MGYTECSAMSRSMTVVLLDELAIGSRYYKRSVLLNIRHNTLVRVLLLCIIDRLLGLAV